MRHSQVQTTLLATPTEKQSYLQSADEPAST